MHACARDHSSDANFKGSRKGKAFVADSGSLRQPVVRSGGAAHRPAAPPRRSLFQAAESLVAPVSPSLTKDVFSIGDNSRNTN